MAAFSPGFIPCADRFLQRGAGLYLQNINIRIAEGPLLRLPVISACMGPEVELIDVGEACARYVAGVLEQENLLAGQNRNGGCSYYVSDTVDGFSTLASRFLGRDVAGCVERVDIDKY